MGKEQERALEALWHRDGSTPVAVAGEASSADETINVTTLAQMTEFPHDKRTVIIVGNSTTKTAGDWMITPRVYAE